MVCSSVQAHYVGIQPTAQVRKLDFLTSNNSNDSLTGFIRLGDILEILPFEDPIVVLELDGASLWDALEASLAKWPAQEG